MRSLVLSAALLLSTTSCSVLPAVRSVVAAQTPGTAQGAGASVVGPSNAAASTTQVAERREAYFPPLGAPGVPLVSPTVALPPMTDLRFPAWSYEKVTTSIGQHQDAASIVKVAQSAAGWPTLRWLGFLCILIGIGGILHAQGNHETGYPLIWMKVAGLGLFFVFAGDNPFWLLLLLIPIGFYAVQKFGLWKLPLP